ncbi:MAG: twin-arginine translocase subunit TatC [Sulfobacillus acidophilus]|uniref:Sec-independent protein translocase protein TatC n=1 Tax=Sulfobacillus acidophilus TaxID=53633 RepID=A0A2T2WJ09_9FIRM|nr:MAG: twin-arginine translocase subunit TatC [Sulfobacillus acidophilus]
MYDREMSLTEHLTELRRRLIVVVVTVGILFLGGFYPSRPVLHWLVVRAHVKHIIVIGVPEAFFALIKVDLMLSLVVASPVILYEVAAFVLPGLTDVERRVVGLVVGPGLALFMGGMAAGFFVFVPLVLHVMLTFVGPGVGEYWTLTNYLNFITYLTIPFGFLAELPLISGILAHLGLISPAMFRRYRRYAIVISFLIAAIIAPPDALSMLVIGSAIYLVYEASYVVARIFHRRAREMETAVSGTPGSGSQ